MKESALFERILTAASFNSIIPLIAADICKLLSAERITIFQKGRDDQEIVSRFKTGPNFKEIRLPMGPKSIAGYVALSQQPLFFKDVYLEKALLRVHPKLRFDSSFDEQYGFKTKSMLAIPIKDHNVLLGVFQVINKVGGGSFTLLEAKRALDFGEVFGKKI